MQFLQYQPQKRGPRHQNETINNDIDPSRKVFVSHTNSGTIPSTGGLGQPRFPEWNLQRRQTFLTAQTCHTKRKPRKRNTQKKGLRSQHVIEQRKANRTKRRRESRILYRTYWQHVQKARSGKARPAGLSQLAQGTLQTGPGTTSDNFL